MKKELLIQYLKSNVNVFFVKMLFFVALFGCQQQSKFKNDIEYYPTGKGFTLQQFEVINFKLDSLIRDAIEKVKISNKTWEAKNVVLLDLLIDDTREILFNFTFVNYYDISEHHIFNDIQRIVGYIDIKNDTLIVLSNVHSKRDFECTFYKFIRPTSKKQYFDYIYFPDDLYKVSENGIPPPPLLYDYYRFGYFYKNNEFHYYEENE